MNRFRRQAILTVAAVFVAAPLFVAQLAAEEPHIGYVYPSGAQRGTLLEVTVGGQHLKETNETYMSGDGIDVKVVKYYKPFTTGQVTRLRLKMDEVRKKLEAEQAKQGKTGRIPLEVVAKAAGVTENDLKEMEVYRQRRNDPKRQPNSQIEEEITLQITVAPDAAMGKRELRLITPEGMSNPLWFIVNQWEERHETEPNDVKPDPTIGSTLPVVVGGQIMPGDVDRFSFFARKGTRLVIDSAVRDLMPYLADAVPGWFQAVLVLYDADGNELAYAGAFHYRQDPVIYYEVPKDGEYIIEIRDSIYRGREDFVYRITLGELPFVTGIFPLGGRAGTEVSVELQGWNLVENQLDVRAIVNRNRPVRWFSLPQTDKLTVRFPLRIDMTSEVLDTEPNDTEETAQEVSMPIVVNGRIDKPDDHDVFRFDGYGKLVADVFARRGGSPVDSTLTLLDSEGKEIGFNDDHEDKSQPLITHHADSRLEVPLSGKPPYYLHLTDAQRKGGHDFIYRLYIRPPRPDFDLRITPSSVMAKPGETVPITAYALRREGFNDDIQLSLVGAPEGYKLQGALIPSGAEKLQLTLAVPPEAPEEPVALEMDGQSLGGHGQRKVSRPAVPAENMMQAFIWYQLVPAEQWTVVVRGKAESKFPLELPRFDRLKLKLGETTTLPVRLTGKSLTAEEVAVELNEPPPGFTVEKVSPQGPGVGIDVAVDADTVKPGTKGNLVFRVYREWTPPPTEERPMPKAIRRSYGVLPAVPFEVVGRAPRK